MTASDGVKTYANKVHGVLLESISKLESSKALEEEVVKAEKVRTNQPATLKAEVHSKTLKEITA